MKTDTTSIIIKSLVESHSDKMYSWALYKTTNKETSEDLVQETFLVAFQLLPGYLILAILMN